MEIASRYGEPLAGHGGSLVLEPRPLPPLALPSGRLVVCDPFVEPGAPPLAVRFPAGAYPVVLAVARLDGGDERVAFATVETGAGAPVRWEPAALDGVPAPRRGLPGFGVDSATAALFDATVGAALAADPADPPGWAEAVADGMGAVWVDTWGWAAVAVAGVPGANLLACSTGYGDGFYTSHLGFDAAGRCTRVVTDFAVVRGAADAARPWWRRWLG